MAWTTPGPRIQTTSRLPAGSSGGLPGLVTLGQRLVRIHAVQDLLPLSGDLGERRGEVDRAECACDQAPEEADRHEQHHDGEDRHEASHLVGAGHGEGGDEGVDDHSCVEAEGMPDDGGGVEEVEARRERGRPVLHDEEQQRVDHADEGHEPRPHGEQHLRGRLVRHRERGLDVRDEQSQRHAREHVEELGEAGAQAPPPVERPTQPPDRARLGVRGGRVGVAGHVQAGSPSGCVDIGPALTGASAASPGEANGPASAAACCSVRGHLERPAPGQRQRRDGRAGTKATELLVLRLIQIVDSDRVHLGEVLAPGGGAPPESEDIRDPDGMAPRPAGLARPQNARRDVAGAFDQGAGAQDQDEDAGRAEPQRYSQKRQDRPNHDRISSRGRRRVGEGVHRRPSRPESAPAGPRVIGSRQ